MVAGNSCDSGDSGILVEKGFSSSPDVSTPLSSRKGNILEIGGSGQLEIDAVDTHACGLKGGTGEMKGISNNHQL